MKRMNIIVVVLLVATLFGAQVALAAPTGITNPLGANTGTVQGLITNVISWLLKLVGLLALLAFVVAGLMYILAFGDEKKVANAKQIITYSIIGLVVIISAYAILSAVTTALGIAP